MVSCTRGFTALPVMSPKTPEFRSFFQDFVVFVEIFRKNYNVFRLHRDIVVRKPKIIPLNTIFHRFNIMVVRGVTRNTKKSPKNDLFWVIFRIFVIFWS